MFWHRGFYLYMCGDKGSLHYNHTAQICASQVFCTKMCHNIIMEEKYTLNYGEMLKEQREKMGWSQSMVAKKINTYDISIKPYEDCCTVFVPEHPVIKPKIDLIIEEEKKCDLDLYIEDAIANIETYEIRSDKKINVLDTNNDIFDI